VQYDETHNVDVFAKAAGVVIFDEHSNFLLVKESHKGKQGLWHIPSGTVETGESPEQAALREVFEETGLTITLNGFVDAFLGRFDDDAFVMRYCWWATHSSNQSVQPVLTDEISEAKFFSKLEFDELYRNGNIRMHHTKLMVEAAITLCDNT
jgi:8-oxo-dGTP pyrophosphatase MutT (NUDIX family)